MVTVPFVAAWQMSDIFLLSFTAHCYLGEATNMPIHLFEVRSMPRQFYEARGKADNEQHTLVAQILDTPLDPTVFFLYNAIIPAGPLRSLFTAKNKFNSPGASFAFL